MTMSPLRRLDVIPGLEHEKSALIDSERKFWGDELLLARSSRIFVMTRPLHCHELACVLLYTCTVVLWLSVEYRCTLVE